MLGLTPFATSNRNKDIIHIKDGGTVESVLSRMVNQATGSLFTGITATMPDAIAADGEEVYSDELWKIRTTKPIATCKDKSGKVVDCVSLLEQGPYRVAFDSGMQRFYAAYLPGEDGPVCQYLANIVRLLAN